MNHIPLGVYRHYKGNLYEVIGFAKHSETMEDMVVYKALYGECGTWVRPVSMWETQIEVDDKTVKRFEYISDNTGDCDRRRELSEAIRSIESTLAKCEKVIVKLHEGASQHTLTKRRIEAFKIAIDLIRKELENEE